MYYRALGPVACAERLGISLANDTSSSIQELYGRGEYEKILHHNFEDVLVTERLYYHIMNCDFSYVNCGAYSTFPSLQLYGAPVSLERT